MKEGYIIIHRGLSTFDRIYVLNWKGLNQIDMVRWDGSFFTAYDRIVAVFKIKHKQIN